MKVRTNMIFLTILIGANACNVYQDIQVTRNRKIDFNQYGSYAWLPDVELTGESPFDNDYVRLKVKNYLIECLKERSLKADSLNPDLLIRATWLSHPREIEVPVIPEMANSPNQSLYAAPTIVLFGGHDGVKFMLDDKYLKETIKYAHGGIKLTVIDRRINRIVWDGVSQGDLYDPKVMYEDLHPAIHRLMKRFPIKISKE